MIKVSIIGSGNVAQHLITAFNAAKGIEVIQVFCRNPLLAINNLAPKKIITSLSELIEADVYILAVSDDAISEVSQQLPFENRFIVHTSGAASLDLLYKKNRGGVFYPLQTFTRGKAVNFETIPICLESFHSDDFSILEKIANSISNHVYTINSEQRKALHVAAVFVNNFTNHLYHLGEEICVANSIPFDILKPLIIETAQKIQQLSPTEAQTGPAKRKDFTTLNTHESFLTDENQKKIYQILTQSIQDHG
jgi:predicted short-subunit dehydrogenase-like oxidoreductase (DUF2520 family)